MARILIACWRMRYEFSASEKLQAPTTYTDQSRNKIVYNQFSCTDSERIRNGEASFFAEVFDPKTADSTQDTVVSGSSALLCEKSGRTYLIWYPNENTILDKAQVGCIFCIYHLSLAQANHASCFIK